MERYQLLIEYVGTNFRGWQIQKKGSTIQGLIQDKLTKLLKEKVILNGSGSHQTRFVNTDDYRAQEFPDGTPVTAATYFLRIHKS